MKKINNTMQQKTLFDFDYLQKKKKPAQKKMTVKNATEAGHILRTSKVFSKRSTAATALNAWKYGKTKKRK